MSGPEAPASERMAVGKRIEACPQSAEASATPPPSRTGAAVGCGKPTRSSENLDRAIRQIAARLKRDFADEIARDAAAFKRRAVHRLRLHLPPGPGRPCLGSVTQAAEMRAQGKPWKDIYPACIPGHATMDPASRQVAQWNLRNAVRSRRNARRRRSKARVQISASANPISDVSPLQPSSNAIA